MVGRMLGLLLIVLFIGAAGEQPIKLYVRPQVGMAPLVVRVRLTIPKHDDNRRAYLIWDSDEGSAGLNEIDLLANPYVTHEIGPLRLPQGNYLFQGVLMRVTDGKQKELRSGTLTVQVSGPGAQDEIITRGEAGHTEGQSTPYEEGHSHMGWNS